MGHICMPQSHNAKDYEYIPQHQSENSLLNAQLDLKLSIQPHCNNQYTQNGIYKLTCKICQKSYIGQSGCKIGVCWPHITEPTWIGSHGTNYGASKERKQREEMNTWEDYYILYFTHQNEITEEQICTKYNSLFQLTYSTHATCHTTDTHPSQSLPGNQADRTQT